MSQSLPIESASEPGSSAPGLASRLALILVAAASLAAAQGPRTLSFGGREYQHRWSEDDRHEFTPAGQGDLSAWTDMLTLIALHDVWDGEELAAHANRVLANYRAHGMIVKTDSKRRTLRRPAEHLIVALLPTPELIEAVFARLVLIDDTGVIVVASHRIYGTAAGDAMSDWLEHNGPAWEETLMSWRSIPPPDSLDEVSGEPDDEAVGAMAVLRGHLEIVRLSPPPVERKPWPRPDASVLVGLSRAEIERGLGAPDRCRPVDSMAAEGAECDRARTWIFPFYRLPPGVRGGGLELVVEFSADGTATSSEWVRTQ